MKKKIPKTPLLLTQGDTILARLGTIVIYFPEVTQTGCYENDAGSKT